MTDSTTQAEWNVTCGICGHAWSVPLPAAEESMFPSIPGQDRYVQSVCPACGLEYVGDLSATGAIQDPAWLRAAELYDWDDDE